MKKRSTLLKVVAIIMVVVGGIGIPSGIFTLINRESLSATYAMLGMESPGTSYYIFTLLSAVVELAAGIVALMYRSKKSVLIMGCIWVAVVIIGMGFSISIMGVSPTLVLSLLFPILYLWGWYQSE
ncbi:MAG: hypothetical protein HFH24_02735 [Ruminococcus sp.]|nr:hypothetical protein [Ruminococcus sp.]